MSHEQTDPSAQVAKLVIKIFIPSEVQVYETWMVVHVYYVLCIEL